MELLARITFGLLIIGVILLAIIIGGIRLVLVNIEYFKPEIEYLISRDSAPEIVFSGVSGTMNRFNPVLRIENVSINLPDRSQPLFVDRLEVEFDFWASLREQTIVVLEISSKLERLELTRDDSGKWWADRFELGAGEAQTGFPDFEKSLNLVPQYLKIDLNRLIVKDQLRGVTHQIDRVAAHINRQQHQLFVQLSLALPDHLGRGAIIKSVLGKERSLLYMKASNIQMQPVMDLLNLDLPQIQGGIFNGELWANLEGDNLYSLSGNLEIKQGHFQFAEAETVLAYEYQSRFRANRRQDKWSINNNIENFRLEDKTWKQIKSRLDIDDLNTVPHLSIWLDRVKLAGLPGLPPGLVTAATGRLITDTQLSGEVEDLVMQYNLERPQDFALSGRAIGISTLPARGLPGIDSIDAEFTVARDRVGIELKGQNTSLDFGDQFRAPIRLEQLSLKATIDLQGSITAVAINDIQASNEDARLEGRAWLEIDRYQRPFMFLRASFSDAHAASAARYVPVKLMPEKTIAWIDNGIRKGFSPEGELQFHGRLENIGELTQQGAGEFFVDFEIQDAEVMFAPEWLSAKNGEGRVQFHNVGVTVDLDRVSYENLDNGQAAISIADFNNPLLVLEIKAEAPVGDAFRIWSDSPVGENFRKAVGNLHDFGGRVKTKIDVDLPLGSYGESKVVVKIDLLGGRALSRNWGLDLTGVNGQVLVRDGDISASQLDALYFGDPIKVDISTNQVAEQTNVIARGRVETRNLLILLPDSITAKLDGKSDWKIELGIAARAEAPEFPFLALKASSQLQQTQSSLPVPFAKPAASIVPVIVDLEFYPEKINFDLSLGAEILARGYLSNSESNPARLTALDLAFASQLRTNTSDGLHLYGFIPEISLGDWLEMVRSSGDESAGLLQSVELKLDRVTIYSRSMDNVQIELEQVGNRFIGLINSSLIRGNFQVPHQQSATDPINIDLEYLRIDKIEDQQEQAANLASLTPSDLFNLRIKSQSLVFHDLLFNHLEVETRIEQETMHIDTLKMRRDNVQLTGSAKWEFLAANNTHRSSIKTRVDGPKFGQAIAALGFGDSIQDGQIDFSGEFNWPAALYDFSWESFGGTAKMKLVEGTLNNVEPGSGRFVGLLSWSALPRRLSLDFSDLLIKGMDFDEITGSYTIKNGDLFTNNTRMDGPAARIKITGKTGIPARDYDQVIRVTPKIRQTLPIIGAVSAGSAVGWGLLLLQNLFKKVIDKAVEVEYKVTGSWDDPKIELVKAVDENQTELPDTTR